MLKPPLKLKKDQPSALMPIAVDVDLVRFEKNLLQIGFFGANDARDKHRTTRRIEQIVSRNGHKVKVAAELRGPEQLGLPSTTDRDKFIALLKIVSEERAKVGQISNPIRFSGYRMIQELGLSRNGEIYEEIVRWGKRMTDTTITSEHVVYRAAKKLYSDEVLHVFRSFRRTGSSNLDGTEKQENYEVVLEDWLLENLNQRARPESLSHNEPMKKRRVRDKSDYRLQGITCALGTLADAHVLCLTGRF
jgi:Replication initiator protein A